ncbi:MAG: response regulator [Anaerolineae bacterium]|nr:response regulator [Anaerolineae bacterium]
MKKIMLIEDDSTMRSLLKTLLEIEGFAVVVVGDTQQEEKAIMEALQNEKPDCLIMDVNLRKASGINILKDIRKNKEIKNLKVIMSSGMDLRDQCLQSGADVFLMKPYMPDDLIKYLRSLERTNP